MRLVVVPALVLAIASGAPAVGRAEPTCARVVSARVVALDQPYWLNRYGAYEPQGMVFALERDIVATGHDDRRCPARQEPLVPGQVRLRASKRPRPLVLRINAGDCLDLHFTNLLALTPVDGEQPTTRAASIHVQGLAVRTSTADGGMRLGTGAGDGLVQPGESIDYRLYAPHEGTYLLISGGAMVGGEGDGGSISAGLFGAVTVEPPGSRYFRSQVTEKELRLATRGKPGAHPLVIDYEAHFPATSLDPDLCFRPAGSPILEMVDDHREIVHSDLTAIVTGPDLGLLAPALGADNPAYRDRDGRPTRRDPFREFTIIFHDEIGAVQAFSHFEDRILSHTLHSVGDAFAINYGAAGAGAEILANRLGVGPAKDCVECKYEEFFLTAWAVGDPSMVVDVPTSEPCTVEDRRAGRNCLPDKRYRATRAAYPDDPSNVYHSYLSDPVWFRNLHAGSDDHHIFHLHAHQWLHTPASDTSSYHDSQAIGQGTAFTYQIAYGGSGNRNKTVGDSIFHCHFYPHFAQGMWSLWRVHDVLETGTRLDGNGRPVHQKVGGKVLTSTRALPDGEIVAGTPIPALVPIPSTPASPRPQAPLPTTVRLVDGQIDTGFVTAAAQAAKRIGNPAFSPGWPFFVAGLAGHRPPPPPNDFARDEHGQPRDGGLSRHVVETDARNHATAHLTRLDFNKKLHRLKARFLDAGGTPIERLAMDFHAQTALPNGFALNGAPPQPGAPFADPCWTDGRAVERTRIYRAADIQLDVVFTKDGWHFPQERILTLISDVAPTLAGARPPEPLFIRVASGECIHYEQTNLVPNVYEADDFQVKTPTDVIGQHIHLVKFDVTASDGGGNGFNYEDGTFSPAEVQERIAAIRAFQGCKAGEVSRTCPEAQWDARFERRPEWLGAQTTIQRWWADPLLDRVGSDRTLRTVFTHDHFGPSTHQQVGLYAGLVVEPTGSKWTTDNFWDPSKPSKLELGTAPDGSPTSWQAEITEPCGEAYREFLLELADFQLAYERDSRKEPAEIYGFADPAKAINPPGRRAVGPPRLYEKPVFCPINENDPDGTLSEKTAVDAEPGLLGDLGPCPDAEAWAAVPSGERWRYACPTAPCPEAVSADDPGFGVVNYRAEPLAARILDRSTGTAQQSAGLAGDLAFAYESRTDRANDQFNVKPLPSELRHVPYQRTILNPKYLEAGDPFTPILVAFEGERIQIRTLVGAHEEEHEFTLHGQKWRFEPFDADSGWRSSQMNGLSEWFDFLLPPIPTLDDQPVDLLYKASSAAEWQWDGLWGLLRICPNELHPEAAAAAVKARRSGRALAFTESAVEGWSPTRSGPSREDKQRLFGPLDPDSDNARAAGDTPFALNSKEARSLPLATPSNCPVGAPVRTFHLAAVAARSALPDSPGLGRTLVYNPRPAPVRQWDPEQHQFCDALVGPLHDPTAVLFVRYEDLAIDSYGTPRLRPDAPVEPVVLRANAGECLELHLDNLLPKDGSSFGFDQDGWSGWHMLYEDFNANAVRPSLEIGLHPQLVFLDPARDDGSNVGRNPTNYGRQTVAPGESKTYRWYAGEVTSTGLVTPIELGSAGLTTADPLKGTNKGTVGALVIEPAGASWDDSSPGAVYLPGEAPRKTRLATTVTSPAGSFREFVVVLQDDVNLRYGSGKTAPDKPFPPVANHAVNEDPTESGQKAFDYRTEPIWYRLGYAPETPTEVTRSFDFADALLDATASGPPVTPTFTAAPGDAVRFRVVHPGGHTQSHAFEVQGHDWRELPYLTGSARIGPRPASGFQGSQHGVGPTRHLDVVIDEAGGPFRIEGDYLYRDYVSWGFDGGIWGLLRIRF